MTSMHAKIVSGNGFGVQVGASRDMDKLRSQMSELRARYDENSEIGQRLDDFALGDLQVKEEAKAAAVLQGEKRANVFCPGPSLHKAELPSEYDGLFAISLNQAIAGPFPANVWVAQDAPWPDGEAHEAKGACITAAKSIKPQIWTYRSYVPLWKEMCPDSSVVGNPHTTDYAFRFLPWMSLSLWLHKSIMAGICRLIVLGVKEINLWGCDMSGQYDYCPMTGDEIHTKITEKEKWDARWKNEEKLLARIQREAHKNGVEIRRHKTHV